MLGLWIEPTEGAEFWLTVMTELKTRGVEDILIAVVDGLAGFPEAIETVFPQAAVHPCVVHLVRSRLDIVSYKDRKAVSAALRKIYRAADTEDAHKRPGAPSRPVPGARWYAPIGTMWRRHWAQIIPFFAFARNPPGRAAVKLRRASGGRTSSSRVGVLPSRVCGVSAILERVSASQACGSILLSFAV